ncbi:LacI family DNA-binding transcriptional regulator [Fodinicola acaciae]|uniref:LacI family DNA-binding transcriptional regulator n=1 Tax=Fodinicola acaciae TaxID=2681555 RepID=UPI0013D066C9|nr:LacI family DNA-binding transcriptional regulator [Fodinicola acaciae]
MYASLKDVAAHAGVSFQTVSKVLKGAPVAVSEQTRQRILAAAEELGYVPNAVARGLLSRSTYSIGIVADDLDDWALGQFVIGAEREARGNGHAVIIGTALGEDGPLFIRQLLERRVDGILSAAPRLEANAEIGTLLRGRVPAVSVHHVPGGGVPVVGSNHRDTGRLVADHLVDLGHRRVAMVAGPADRRVVSARSKGFQAALADRGVRLPASRIVQTDWSAQGGFAAVAALLDRDPTISAMFAHNDLIALGVLSALHSRGVRVPDDCAVAGCDEMPFTGYLTPPLTTVRIPMQETGKRAMSLLLSRIRGEEVASRVLLPVQLVVRASTAGSSTEEGK